MRLVEPVRNTSLQGILRFLAFALVGFAVGFLFTTDMIALPGLGGVNGPVLGFLVLAGAMAFYWQSGACGCTKECGCKGECGDRCTI